jgi:hypothetical protein
MFKQVAAVIEALDQEAGQSRPSPLRRLAPPPINDPVEEGMKASEFEHRQRLQKALRGKDEMPPMRREK